MDNPKTSLRKLQAAITCDWKYCVTTAIAVLAFVISVCVFQENKLSADILHAQLTPRIKVYKAVLTQYGSDSNQLGLILVLVNDEGIGISINDFRVHLHLPSLDSASQSCRDAIDAIHLEQRKGEPVPLDLQNMVPHGGVRIASFLVTVPQQCNQLGKYLVADIAYDGVDAVNSPARLGDGQGQPFIVTIRR